MGKRYCVSKLRALLASVKRKVDVIAADKREIFIFGAGNTSTLYVKCFDVEGIKPAGFLDNDPKKQGTAFLRGGVLPPDSLQGRKDVLVLICSAQLNVQAEVSAQLESLGLSYLFIDEYVFAKRMDEILKCVELLDDEESAEIYAEVIESRLFGRLPSSKIFNREKYCALAEFCTISEKEVFVDCGAFVGDTIEEYLLSREGTFGNIIAFEPDTVNFHAMQTRVERLNREWALKADKIQLVNAGVGNLTTEGTVNHAGHCSIISEQKNSDSDEIKIYALDDYFSARKIDFLKADIESFETNMLKGAEKIIRRDLPKIAVCIYHNASDMYQILLWLARLNLGYKFSIRHHSTLNMDTVLYAFT